MKDLKEDIEFSDLAGFTNEIDDHAHFLNDIVEIRHVTMTPNIKK